MLLAVLMGIVACGGQQTSRESAPDSAQLARELVEKDSLLNDVFMSINEIAENLSVIKSREGIVTSNLSGDITKEQRAQINEDIAAINELLIQNRASLERLKGTTDRLRSANVKVQELEALVENLTKQIRDKDADIQMLRGELADMRVQVAELNTLVDEMNTSVTELTEVKGALEATVQEQTDAMHTVYYMVGSEKSLRDANIIDKSGFIGRTVTLTDQYNLQQFTQVDSRVLDRINIGGRRATVVTPHPADSYTLEVGANNVVNALVITDPDRFWEASKVLVVSFK